MLQGRENLPVSDYNKVGNSLALLVLVSTFLNFKKEPG